MLAADQQWLAGRLESLDLAARKLAKAAERL
jgi:hypothetical protein